MNHLNHKPSSPLPFDGMHHLGNKPLDTGAQERFRYFLEDRARLGRGLSAEETRLLNDYLTAAHVRIEDLEDDLSGARADLDDAEERLKALQEDA